MKNIIIIAVVAVVLLGGVGGGLFMMWSKLSALEARLQEDTGPEEGEEAVVDEAPKPIFKMATLIANLADPGGRRYLRATMDLEIQAQEDEQKVEGRIAQVKDATLKIFSTRTFEDINGIAGREALRDELIAKLNEILKGEIISNIYFSEFVIQ